MNVAAHIMPAKLRSGAPETLAALCDRRGAAVFAYCRRAAGDEAAVAAAAEAFAQFRRAIQPADALAGKGKAELLLRSATRRSALVHADHAAAMWEADAGTEGCEVRGAALLVYVEGALGPAEREVVATHVRQCTACAAVLRRLQDAEAAFDVKPGTPLPIPVAREILTALVDAAPVASHGASATAVRDEALRLLTAEDGPAAVAPAPPAPTPPDDVDDASPPLAPPPPAVPPTPTQAPPQTPPAAGHRVPRRPGLRLASFGRERFGPGRSAMLLRGVAKFVAVVVLAGAAGIGLGIAIAELTGDDDASPATAPTSSAPGTTTTAAATSTLGRSALAGRTEPARTHTSGSRISIPCAARRHCVGPRLSAKRLTASRVSASSGLRRSASRAAPRGSRPAIARIRARA